MLPAFTLLALTAYAATAGASAGPRQSGPSVTLDYGTFIGVEDTTTEITSFKGVRYAEPPVGDLRWKAPVFPPTTQLGTVEATQYGNACIPVPQTSVIAGTSEDCLFANIWVPAGTTSDDSLPVMIWIHGGGFQTGNSQVNPIPMMQSSTEPLVFVSIEYRLGQFGFLASPSIEADGGLNAGLLDQRTAFRWVQRYISEFGGDPSQVTIWGESAGAGSTMFHLIANNGDSDGLFHAAMGDSPSLSLTPLYSGDYLEGIFNLFATSAGCMLSTDILECLRNADANTLAAAGTSVLNNRTSTLFVFAPIQDSGFIATRPVEAFASGAFAKIPVLFGSNTNEGAHWSASLPDPNANTSEPNATQETVYNFIKGQYPNFTQASFDNAVELYPLSDYNNSFSLQGQQMYGEARYICSAVMITAAADRVGSSAFQYHYDNPDQGSDHGSDLQALFNAASTVSGDDATLFSAMQEYWTSFVTTGTPTAADGSSWTAVSNSTSGSERILLHPGGIQMEEVTDALAERCAFWHSISEELST